MARQRKDCEAMSMRCIKCLIMIDDIVSQDEKGHGWVFTPERRGVAKRVGSVLEGLG